MNDDTFLTQDELARRWKISVFTLASWRREGRGPAYMKAGGRTSGVRYSIDDVKAYEQEKRIVEPESGDAENSDA